MKPYDWTQLKNNTDIRNNFITEVNNRFEVLENAHSENISTNTAYNHFETACKESDAKVIPLKQKLKKRTP